MIIPKSNVCLLHQLDKNYSSCFSSYLIFGTKKLFRTSFNNFKLLLISVKIAISHFPTF